MLRTFLPEVSKTSAFSSRVVLARVQSRACSQCKSVKDWKELHGPWSRYSTTQVQRRSCSLCKSMKDWKELHGAWSRYSTIGSRQQRNTTSSFATSSQLRNRKGNEAPSERDVNTEDVAFEGKKSSAVNTEPTSQPRSGKPSDKQTPDDTPEVPDELKHAADAKQNTTPGDTSAHTGRETTAEPEVPLPDLRQGIPSTLDKELEQAERASRGEGGEEVASSLGGRRGERARPASDFTTSAERKRNQLFKYFAGAGILGIAGFFIYQGRDWETAEEAAKHPEAPSGISLSGFYNRMKARFGSTVDYYNEPAFQKLLPDPDPQWAREYTLVLSLEDLLVHQEWTREHGWRLAKRPGVDYFLRYLSNYYELVIFTSIPSMNADPIIRKLDPYRIIMWPLFREATKYKNGEYVKDLSFINRDLSKTILIDTSAAHASAQPENAIILPKWNGDPTDRDLVALIPFLEYVAALQIPDLRKALASFDGKHIPTEFAAREAAAREKFLVEERARNGGGNGKRKTGLGALGGMFGVKGDQQRMDGFESVSEGVKKGKMLHDQIRERGQMAYMELEKQIRENGEKWLKEMAVEEEKAKEEYMKSMTAGFGGWFGGGRKPGGEGTK